MNWFSRKQEPSAEEAWPPALEVHPVDFSPKPQDLVEAAHAEWTRPTLMPAPTDSLPWSKEPPRQQGLYWWRPIGYLGDLAYLAVVVDFGGRLSVRRSASGSSTFISANTLARQWAGPVLLPDGMRLERLGIEP